MTAKKVSRQDQDNLISDLVHGKISNNLDKTDKTILFYVVKLTRTPHLITANDIGQLKEEGFDDRAIHDICAITAYFAFVNRMADGLGVELEDRFSERDYIKVLK